MDTNENPRPREEFTTARIRAACREGFQQATPYITQIATGQVEDTTPAVATRAYDSLGRYGIGRHPELVIDHSEWLEIILEVTKSHYPEEEAFQAWWADIVSRFEEVK